MESQLFNANVVVAARQFNPTIFDQLWLINNGIADSEDFKGDDTFILTPPFVQFRSSKFVLMVMSEQLQFVPHPISNDSGSLVAEKVGTIVRLLPQTPYVAVGLNFVWHLIPETVEYKEFCKSLFFRANPLFASFDTEDARYGSYLSKDVLGSRLKLDIKPVKISVPAKDTIEILQFVFNYNVDLGRANAVEEIERTLGQWNEANDYAKQVVSNLESWQWK